MLSVVGLLQDEADPMVSVMKVRHALGRRTTIASLAIAAKLRQLIGQGDSPRTHLGPSTWAAAMDQHIPQSAFQ